MIHDEGLSVVRTRMGPSSKEMDQLDSPFLARERVYANDPTKRKHRSRIARFFLRSLGERDPHCLSLPSYHWSFEHVLMEMHDRCSFVGVERVRSVLDESVPYMPGKNRHRFELDIKGGHLSGWESTHTTHLWSCIGDLLSMNLNSLELAVKPKKGKSKGSGLRWIRNFNCAWLDFQSMICAEVETALRHLSSALEKQTDSIPVAITIMAAREPKDVGARIAVFGGRVQYVKALLELSGKRKVGYMRATPYLSSGGCPMILIVARLDAVKGV